MINYPNGSPPYQIAKNIDNHSKRGATLEKDINASNTYYKDLNIADL